MLPAIRSILLRALTAHGRTGGIRDPACSAHGPRASKGEQEGVQVDEAHRPGERGDAVGDAQLGVGRAPVELLDDRRVVEGRGVERVYVDESRHGTFLLGRRSPTIVPSN
jgi:hypothetical protein